MFFVTLQDKSTCKRTHVVTDHCEQSADCGHLLLWLAARSPYLMGAKEYMARMHNDIVVRVTDPLAEELGGTVACSRRMAHSQGPNRHNSVVWALVAYDMRTIIQLF